MIVVFNKGLSSEQSYQIHSCVEKLHKNLEDDSTIQALSLMYQVPKDDVSINGNQYFYDILQDSYKIQSINIEFKGDNILSFDNYNQIVECKAVLNEVNNNSIVKFISILIYQGGI